MGASGRGVWAVGKSLNVVGKVSKVNTLYVVSKIKHSTNMRHPEAYGGFICVSKLGVLCSCRRLVCVYVGACVCVCACVCGSYYNACGKTELLVNMICVKW